MYIYRIVQLLLLCLLIFVAMQFQQIFVIAGKPEQFIGSLLFSIVCQLLLLYPTYRLAQRDVGIEIDSNAESVAPESLKALRKKRLLGDLWKFCIVVFFITFVALAPDAKKAAGAPKVLATTIFTFLLICLTYFQCFNFNAKKRISHPG
jgi:hypothetical protein